MYDGGDVEETHEHFNGAGELVGTTKVTKHSPWDEEARGEAEALFEAERLVCPECGNLLEDCRDPDKAGDWFPQRSVCYAAMNRSAANRRYDDKHKDKPFHDGRFQAFAKDAGKGAPFHVRDGVTVWTSAVDYAPDDRFL